MIGLIHVVIGSFHVCYVYREALRRLMHTEVCIGLDIAHFPSLMYGFIMQQIYIYLPHNETLFSKLLAKAFLRATTHETIVPILLLIILIPMKIYITAILS